MPKTFKEKSIRKRQTLKRKPTTGNYKAHIVKMFLELINMVKLYHWKTRSYAQHKATDDLHASLNKHTDSFVEVLLGKGNSRIRMISKKMKLIDCDNTNDFKARVYEFREFFINMDKYFHPKRDSDLLTLRDELLIDINQFLYLMTFDK